MLIYLIYSLFRINKINYVSISDVSINDQFINKDKLANYHSFYSNSIEKAYQDIKNNKTIKQDNEIYYLKKVLRESDVLVISVGMKELNNGFNKYNMDMNYELFNKMYSNIKILINELKKHAFGRIIFIGYYNPCNYYDANIDRFFYDMNIKLERLMIDNNIIYLDLYELIKGSNYKINNYYLNDKGLKKISSMIDFYLEK